MLIKRPFRTIADLRTMLDGYRKLFDAEPEIRITAYCFEGPDREILFNRMGNGYTVDHIGNKYIVLSFQEEGEFTPKPFKFDPAVQEETLFVIFE